MGDTRVVIEDDPGVQGAGFRLDRERCDICCCVRVMTLIGRCAIRWALPGPQDFQLREGTRQTLDLGQCMNGANTVSALQRLVQQRPVIRPAAASHVDARAPGQVQRVVLLAGGGGLPLQVQRAGQQHLGGVCAQPVQGVQIVLTGQAVVEMGRGLVVQLYEVAASQPGGQLFHHGQYLGTPQFLVHHQATEGEPTVRDAVVTVRGVAAVGWQDGDDPRRALCAFDDDRGILEAVGVVVHVFPLEQENAVAAATDEVIPRRTVCGGVRANAVHGVRSRQCVQACGAAMVARDTPGGVSRRAGVALRLQPGGHRPG